MTFRRLLRIGLWTAATLVQLPILGFAALFATREPPDGPRVPAGPGIVGGGAGGGHAGIVRAPHGAVLVDAGLDADGTAILAELTAQHLGPADVRAILLT